MRRNFAATAPNGFWLVGIAEHRAREGKLYLSAIKDVFSRRFVWDFISDRMKACVGVGALNNAVARRGSVTGCVVGSDRGDQFRGRKFIHPLRHYGLVGSMRRVGAAGDNAAME